MPNAAAGTSRLRWLTTPGPVRAWWWVLILATAVNGVVVGYGAVWFQLFGDRPGRNDYLVSAGGYAAGSLVLASAIVGILGLDGPRRAAWLAGILAVVLALLATRSAVVAAGLPADAFPNGPLDGAGGVLLLPWTWPLLIAGVRGLSRLRNRRFKSRPHDRR